MSKRREFIRTSTYLAAGGLILPAAACSSGKKEQAETAEEKPVATAPKNTMKPGIQVYSVRNQLNEDFAGSMKKLADIGYKLIEGYGLNLDGMFLGKITPEDYKKTIEDLGMSLVATHCGYFESKDASQMIDAAKVAGVDYLIIPYIPEDIRTTIDGYKAVAENLNQIGEQCTAAGITFGYHNHAFEFETMEGQIPQEVLISETDADKVVFEADLYWTVKGEYDPIQLINKFPGRIQLFHVKDMSQDGHEATVGQGTIDFASIFEAGKKAGLEHYFIEDERTDDPFANVKADHDYIVAQSFV
jgi:sugar phosphate isomerase/epimerase